MDYNQYKMEKMVEWIYERQKARVKPERRATCGCLQEIIDVMQLIGENNLDEISFELGKKLGPDCDECDGCD